MRTIKTCVILYLLFMISTIASSVELETSQPAIKASDEILARAENARKTGGTEAESAVLLQEWLKTSENEEDMDDVAIRLVEFARHNPPIREQMLNKCTKTQLIRLSEKGNIAKNFLSVCIFTDEFRKRFPNDTQYPSIANVSAMAHMLIDSNEKKALQLWDEVKTRYPQTKEALIAGVYTEAILGPQSISAMDAAHEVGRLQSRVVQNSYRAMFSHWRILKAADQDFFKQYLSQQEVPAADKAELLAIVLEHAHLAAEYARVPDLAGQIFTLIGYDNPTSIRAAFAIPLSYMMRGNCREAVKGFESFLQAYPKAPDAPKASLYMGQAYEEIGDNINALLQYAFTVESYKNTNEASEAKNCYDVLIGQDHEGKLLSASMAKKTDRLAFLKKPCEPSKIWAKHSLPDSLKPAASNETKLNPTVLEQKYQRLAQLLPYKASIK